MTGAGSGSYRQAFLHSVPSNPLLMHCVWIRSAWKGGWVRHMDQNTAGSHTYKHTDIRIKRIRSEPVNNIYLKLAAMSTHYQTWRYCVCVVKNERSKERELCANTCRCRLSATHPRFLLHIPRDVGTRRHANTEVIVESREERRARAAHASSLKKKKKNTHSHRTHAAGIQKVEQVGRKEKLFVLFYLII